MNKNRDQKFQWKISVKFFTRRDFLQKVGSFEALISQKMFTINEIEIFHIIAE